MEYFVLVNDDGEMQGMSVEGDITDEELWFRATSQCPKVDEVLPLPYAVRAALQVLEYAATEKQLSRHILDVLMSITETTPPLGVSYKTNSDIEVEIEDSDEDKGEPYVYTELDMGGEVAQRLEQGAHNALVGGSSPSEPTIRFRFATARLAMER